MAKRGRTAWRLGRDLKTLTVILMAGDVKIGALSGLNKRIRLPCPPKVDVSQ